MEDQASFPAELASAARARHHAERVLSGWGLDGVLDVVRLLVSELVVNAVTHAGSPVEMVLQGTGSQVRVAVSDRSSALPERQPLSPTSPTGRGLLILDELADEWGVDVDEAGKTVWFEVALPVGAELAADGQGAGDPSHPRIG